MSEQTAKRYADTIERVLNDRKLISGPVPWRSWVLPAFFDLDVDAYAFEVDVKALQVKRIEALHSKATIDDIVTRLGGIKVGFVNSQGLMYLVKEQKLSHLISFPARVDLPEPPGSNYLIPFGITKESEPVWRSLRETENIVVGGQTQYGKTTMFFAWYSALIKQHTPSELKIGIIDGKDFEFSSLTGSPHLIGSEPISGPRAAEALTRHIWSIVVKRKQLFKSNRVGSLDMLERYTGQRLPLILLLVDEIKDLIDAGFDPTFLYRILQQGVGLGVLVIVGTQSPNSKTVKKTNFRTYVAFRLSNGIESGILFGDWRAYELLQDASKGELVVVGPDLNYEHLKSFYVEKHSSGIAPQIDSTGRVVVAIAERVFNGDCPIDKMLDWIAGNAPTYSARITRHYLQKTFTEWESLDLLEPAKRLENGQWQARRITDKLRKLSGARGG